jgi:hypothetical protein
MKKESLVTKLSESHALVDSLKLKILWLLKIINHLRMNCKTLRNSQIDSLVII